MKKSEFLRFLRFFRIFGFFDHFWQFSDFWGFLWTFWIFFLHFLVFYFVFWNQYLLDATSPNLHFNHDFKPESFNAGFQIFTQGQISFKSGTQILHLGAFDTLSRRILWRIWDMLWIIALLYRRPGFSNWKRKCQSIKKVNNGLKSYVAVKWILLNSWTLPSSEALLSISISGEVSYKRGHPVLILKSKELSNLTLYYAIKSR